MRRNRGGWPYRAKTIFDPAATRRAARACDKLHSAIMHIHQTHDRSVETVYGGFYDPVTGRGDRASSDALVILHDAMKQVSAERDARNTAAKMKQQAGGGHVNEGMS